MGFIHRATASGAGVNNPPASAEGVIYTTPNIVMGQGAPVISLRGVANITPGTGATAIIIRIRQGSLTGTQVGPTVSHTVVAGAPQQISFGATDPGGQFFESANPYVVTAQQTGGTGAGTTNMVDLEVIV